MLAGTRTRRDVVCSTAGHSSDAIDAWTQFLQLRQLRARLAVL